MNKPTFYTIVSLLRYPTMHFIFGMLVLNVCFAKPIELILWHSMSGKLGGEVQRLANDFNHSQANYLIRPVYKGGYQESLTSFAAAFRAKQPPSIIQVFEVGTASMLVTPGIIKPLDELMDEQAIPLAKSDFFPTVTSYYSRKGRLMALPFNISIPVIFYNVDALKKIGYSQASFPHTWDTLEVLVAKLRQAGYSCGYTTTYPGWILIESFAAMHGIGAQNASTPLAYNHKRLVAHLQRLVRWQKLHYFEYGGRDDNATILFTSGRCPLLSQSSGASNSLAALVPFTLGIAALPKDKHSSNVLGGAALWAVAGQSAERYRGIALFFAYLAQPSVQKNWHRNTGYLPLGRNGIYQQSFATSSIVMSIAQAELGFSIKTASNIPLIPQNQIRNINDVAVEAIFSGVKTPHEAMAEAAKRADQSLKRFKQNTLQDSH